MKICSSRKILKPWVRWLGGLVTGCASLGTRIPSSEANKRWEERTDSTAKVSRLPYVHICVYLSCTHIYTQHKTTTTTTIKLGVVVYMRHPSTQEATAVDYQVWCQPELSECETALKKKVSGLCYILPVRLKVTKLISEYSHPIYTLRKTPPPFGI